MPVGGLPPTLGKVAEKHSHPPPRDPPLRVLVPQGAPGDAAWGWGEQTLEVPGSHTAEGKAHFLELSF